MTTKSYGPLRTARLPDAALDPPDDYWDDEDETNDPLDDGEEDENDENK